MMTSRVCQTMWHSKARALQFAIPANCLFIGALSFLLPVGPLSAAMMLDAFLLAMAAIGITGRAAVLIVPNIAIKVLLLLIMLFIGCVSIDTFHAHYLTESIGPANESEVVSQSPVSLWRSVVYAYPSLPLWTIAFILLICIEIRLFFRAWYRIAFRTGDGEEKEVERHPPSYAYCISHSPTNVCSSDELPSYEEAVRRSSVQKPCCSKTLLHRSGPPPPRCSTSKPVAESQSENRTQSSGNTKAQLKAQVQRYLKTTAPSDTTSQPRPHRVVAIQIEHSPSAQVELRSSVIAGPAFDSGSLYEHCTDFHLHKAVINEWKEKYLQDGR